MASSIGTVATTAGAADTGTGPAGLPLFAAAALVLSAHDPAPNARAANATNHAPFVVWIIRRFLINDSAGARS
ncbi:MAG: hypothetical protein NT031_12040 [Planctomycetota bacterium]|nr:hypothetical protein [Planctomycetota bacterium]